MPLTLVLGPANAAKAGEVLGAYQPAAHRGALLVVPTVADAEHYDRELGERGGLLGRTLTFPRLLDEIALRAGFRATRLTTLQRRRLLAAVIAELELPSLRGSAASRGFSRAAVGLMSTLGRVRAPAPRFAAALSAWASAHPERRQYARDLGAIALRYAAALAARHTLDAEGFAWEALDRLRERPERWRGTPVYLYGFDDLTEIELDVVTTLATVAGAQVTVSLTFEPDRPALAARAGVVEDLRSIATSVRQLPALDTHYEPAARIALHHLERHLFEPEPPVLDPGEAVVLLEAGGERAEAEQIGDEVAAALADGVDPEEIVVVCRSLQRSGSLLGRALARRGIATAAASRVPLVHTSLGRALIALATCALRPEDAGVSDLLAYLRAPGVVPERDQLDVFEARVRRAGLTELGEVLGSGGIAAVAGRAIEAVRAAADPAAGIAAAARELLAAPRRQAAALLSEAERLDARAAATVLDALAQTATIDRGPDRVLELLAELELGVGEERLAGAVLVAEPLAIRARRFRRVLVTGLCEGEFPSSSALGGDPFLSEDDRRELALASGLVLPVDPDPVARERYLLYACVSRATERVTLSYRSSDEDGNLVVPSPFIDDLERVLGAAWRDRRGRRLLGEDPMLPDDAGATAGAAAPEIRVLGPVARAHVRHTEVVSGNALEAFAACPVRWLVESQLQVRDLSPEPEPLAKGSFMHRVLERVIAGLGGPLTEASLPHAEAALGERLTEVAAEIDFAPGVHGEIRAALLRGIEADLRRYLGREASTSNGWTPAHLELRFGMSAQEGDQPALPLGDSMLRGVIDRIDVDPDGRRAVVRDYKSGRRQADWAAERWQTGHKLQVALYMLAVRRLLGLDPVAGFYHSLSGSDLRPRGAYTAGVDVGADLLRGDALSEGELDELLAEIEQEAIRLAGILRRGELSPCPETCSPSGGGCRYPGICWAAT